mmetsp:Transcript_48629/g.136805  ORF Transcript_48629/g.136805 Transcript_48629/m.136805 type:complete len:279 (+) Transcript_48629:929-1765(+)
MARRTMPPGPSRTASWAKYRGTISSAAAPRPSERSFSSSASKVAVSKACSVFVVMNFTAAVRSNASAPLPWTSIAFRTTPKAPRPMTPPKRKKAPPMSVRGSSVGRRCDRARWRSPRPRRSASSGASTLSGAGRLERPPPSLAELESSPAREASCKASRTLAPSRCQSLLDTLMMGSSPKLAWKAAVSSRFFLLLVVSATVTIDTWLDDRPNDRRLGVEGLLGKRVERLHGVNGTSRGPLQELRVPIVGVPTWTSSLPSCDAVKILTASSLHPRRYTK